MKKRLGLLIRVLLAVGGVAYIVVNLDWEDTLVLPAGFAWPDGTTVQEQTEVGVLRVQGGAGYVILAPGGGELLVPIDRVTPDENTPNFRPAVTTMLRRADLGLLLGGLGLWGLIFPLQVYRWWSLMRCQGLNTSLYKAFRLTMVGTFFNICMPGSTGGDVMKAYYAARGSGARTVAVMSVLMDRLIGLSALVVLAALAGLFMLDDDRALGITAAVWIGLGAMVIMAGIYFTPLRRLIGFDKLIAVLPGKSVWMKVDGAAVAYGKHPGTVFVALALSVLVHLMITTSMAMAGYALGMSQPLVFMIATLPVVLLTQAIPLFPLGLGVADAAAIRLIAAPGLATPNQVLGLMLLQRLYLVFYALLGSIVLIRGDIHLHERVDEPEVGEQAEEDGLAARPAL